MQKEMSESVSFRRFFKTAGLLLAGLLFLGSIEFSASAGFADAQTSYHTTTLSHHIAVSDNILGETEEERDIEARAAIFLLTEIIHLPEQIPGRGYLLPDAVTPLKSYSENSAHARDPPTV